MHVGWGRRLSSEQPPHPPGRTGPTHRDALAAARAGGVGQEAFLRTTAPPPRARGPHPLRRASRCMDRVAVDESLLSCQPPLFGMARARHNEPRRADGQAVAGIATEDSKI